MDKFKQLWVELESGYGRTLEFNPIYFPLCLSFIFLLLFKLFIYKKTTNLPPSPPKLPLIGNLHQLGTLPHRSLAVLSAKYGPDLMHLKLGKIPTLVVSSAKMAREIMKTHDINFSNRPQNTAQKLLFYDCQDMAFASYGEFWRQAKKICVLELLSVKKVESFQNVRDTEVAVLINRIRNGGDFVNLSQLLMSNSNNIASRCIFGEKFEDENGNSKFGDVIKRVMMLLTKFCVADFLPAFRWIDEVRGFIGELQTTFKTLDAFFDRVIEEQREKMCIEDGDQNDKENFVNIMLKLQQDDMFNYHFTRDHLKAILLDMFVGGTDTTATSLEWTMTELMRNPITMKKVQQEVRKEVGKKSKIEMNDIDKMEYMKCVIKESFRLHPAAPLLVPREIAETVNIKGYHIPSKTQVFVNAWAIQRDPEIWERPNEFIPERFINNSIDFQGQDYELIPFGIGRRKCPGISFGVASFEYTLANLLYWFDWKLPDGTLIDLEEQNGLTVGKKTPLQLNPIPYLF